MEHGRDRDFRADYKVNDPVLYAPQLWVMNESIQAMEVTEIAHEGAVVVAISRDHVVIRLDKSEEHIVVRDPKALVKLGVGTMP